MTLEERVLLTLYYATQYLPGLSSEQIGRRLLGEEASELMVRAALSVLVEKSGLVVERDRLYSLKENNNSRLENLEDDAVWLAERQKQIAQVKKFLTSKKWCKGLALTGSQTFRSQKGDIDFLVVTEAGKMWQGRGELLIWAEFKGRKRRPLQETDDGWCFNLWLEEDSLELPAEKQTLMSGYELLQMQWLVDKASIEHKMWSKNSWLKALLGNFAQEKTAEIIIEKCDNGRIKDAGGMKKKVFMPGKQGKLPAEIIIEKCDKGMEKLCYELQYWYRKSKIVRHEVVGRKQAFFHPQRRKNLTMKELETNYQQERGSAYWWRDVNEEMPFNLKSVMERAQEQGKIVVLVTGVFDLLHQAHRDFLRAASGAGDILLVGIESDSRVRSLKGAGRPCCGQLERYLSVLSEEVVTTAFVLPDDFGEIEVREKILRKISPDVLAVSSSSNHLLDKQRKMRELGGEMKVVKNFDQNFSTSKELAKKI